MSSRQAPFDIVISGGGLVGASLACALAALPARIALVESVPPGSASQPSFDDRSIALSRSSQKILAGIGAWQAIRPDASPIREIHVSEQGRFGNAVINAAEQGVDELGHVVASRVLGAALWKQIERARNVEVFCPGSLDAPRCSDSTIDLSLAPGGSVDGLSARLLVVADGARSGLRQALGIQASERSYGQTAIVGNVAIRDCPSRFTAYERFTARGPVALLPFHDGRFVFVMARPSALADEAMALNDADFLALLQEAFGRRLGQFTQLGQRSAYPLSLVRAAELTAPRAAIIGNAAHGLHPVAGQGYNLGLRDVATLAEVTADAIRDGLDPGGPAALSRYADWRQHDQRNVVAFTDGLIRMFDLPMATAGIARGLGLMLFDMLPGAKRALAERTMGMAGVLTRLARGLPL